MENASGLMTLLIIGVMYFLPWIIAASRTHHNRSAIAVLNLLLGWTILGWIAGLVWSLTEVHPPLNTPVRTEGVHAR